jgi:S-adenosylhomocysteine hydrolase
LRFFQNEVAAALAEANISVFAWKGQTEEDFWGQSYKTFYGRNLPIFVMSWSVCPWQAFPA